MASTDDSNRKITRNDLLADNIVELLSSGEKRSKLLRGVLVDAFAVVVRLSDSAKGEV